MGAAIRVRYLNVLGHALNASITLAWAAGKSRPATSQNHVWKTTEIE